LGYSGFFAAADDKVSPIGAEAFSVQVQRLVGRPWFIGPSNGDRARSDSENGGGIFSEDIDNVIPQQRTILS
jgi:hypothetical protein